MPRRPHRYLAHTASEALPVGWAPHQPADTPCCEKFFHNGVTVSLHRVLGSAQVRVGTRGGLGCVRGHKPRPMARATRSSRCAATFITYLWPAVLPLANQTAAVCRHPTSGGAPMQQQVVRRLLVLLFVPRRSAFAQWRRCGIGPLIVHGAS
jgi:hypothetical protein